jgi:hypothetical protein
VPINASPASDAVDAAIAEGDQFGGLDLPAGVPPPKGNESVKGAVHQMRRAGVRMPNPPLQPSENHWLALADAWHEMTRRILHFEKERGRIGLDVGKALFDQGKAERFQVDEYPAPDPDDPSAKETRPWLARHPDQEVFVLYRTDPKTGKEFAHLVRMLPGMDAALDEAVLECENAKRMRHSHAETAFAPYLPYLRHEQRKGR